MNLKEYNYCKRHHPQALARYLGIRVNKFEEYGYETCYIHDANCFPHEPIPVEATYHYLDVSRWLTLTYLV